VLREVPDFEAFVMRGPEHFPRMRVPQIDYLRTRDRTADFIGRTEDFSADLASVCERLGIEPPAEVPRRNAGPPGDYRDHYTPRMRQQVADVYERDLLAFGYRFD